MDEGPILASNRSDCSARPARIVRGRMERQTVDLTLEPLDEFVVVQPVADETETRSGLILPASAAGAAACRTGIVTAVGSEVEGVDAGDKVLYARDSGYEVRLSGIEVRVLKREDIIARIHD